MNSSVILPFIDEWHCLVASDIAEQIASEFWLLFCSAHRRAGPQTMSHYLLHPLLTQLSLIRLRNWGERGKKRSSVTPSTRTFRGKGAVWERQWTSEGQLKPATQQLWHFQILRVTDSWLYVSSFLTWLCWGLQFKVVGLKFEVHMKYIIS